MGPQTTKERLLAGHRWLDVFRAAHAGDLHWQKVLTRYSNLIEAKRAKERFSVKLEEELSWQKRLQNRPILTGALMRPSLFNPPLPRLKPQPIHITMMIRRRRDARERRFTRSRVNVDWRQDLLAERHFETLLHHSHPSPKVLPTPVYEDRSWEESLDSHGQAMKESAQREENRARMKFSPALLELAKQARREKIINKTKEKQRERGGEILNRTKLRMRQGLPAHLISIRGKKGVAMDKVVKSPSEGGYAGMIKRRSGMKTKMDTRPQEESLSDVGERIEGEVRAENRRRMQLVG
ncbi:hypothetical protein FRB93_008258 [Tulasnella sp. JGI-2019a]|nr:hypothetical protein FRB93_008258 [Tulasnella sp. JGI-2019a]